MASMHPESQTDVSVLGLGAMGSVLARTFAKAGSAVTVWNRTAARAAPLAADGCRVAASAAEAVAASPITVMCLLDEESVDDVLSSDGVHQALAGKVLANLTTMPPESVERYGDMVRAASGTYIGGGILCYPRAIGAQDTVIVYSGDRDAFDAHADVLRILAGSQRHLGPGDADASVVYTANWVFYYGGLGGFFEAAAYLDAAGVDVSAFEDIAAGTARQLVGGTGDALRRIATNELSGEQSPIEAHIDVATFADAVRDASVDPRITTAFVDHCRAATEAGYGEQDIAGLFHALRGG
jgi:3-hydroxyisobutyrate dehydrogenase-like beta-hydroxyacid dehydrogenase